MEINRTNYEEFFLLYIDNELPAGKRQAVEEFVESHPDLKEEFDLLSETVLIPNANIVFENKEELYKEDERKVIAIAWWRIAAAAVLIFGLGTFGWLYLNDEPSKKVAPVAAVKKSIEEQKDIIREQQPVTEPAITKTDKLPAEKPAVVNVETQKVKTATVKQKTDPSPLPIEPEIVEIENDQPPIDVAVTPRKLDEEINDVAVSTSLQELSPQPQPQSKPEYVQISDDNIYFANTTVSKRNKFRGVFRKATRILDKVTSFQ